ncbi:adipose-regulatory protein (Seipin) [Ceratobasidium sp. AG-Ba]|nr:adipose-regulatory protein (Seipin) [Ceratobasidium sp. AG-Ba]
MDPTTSQTTLELRLETLVRNAFSWIEEWILAIIRTILFILSIPRRVLPTLLHVAAFTTVLPPLLAVSIGAGVTVVNLIPAGWEAELWMQYGEQAAPYARTSLPSLVPEQPYEISLRLDVPVTPENLALGNFMTKLIIVDPKNSTVASVNRAQALVMGQRSMSWIPFVTAAAGIETIDIPLLASWAPTLPSGMLSNAGAAIARGTTQKDFQAYVTIGRSDAWKSLGQGLGKELSVARAVLHGRVKLFGLRGYFARHTYLLFLLTSTAFFATSTAAALALYLLFAPSLSDGSDTSDTNTVKALGEGRDHTSRPLIKPDRAEAFSASETEYSWTSGGPETRVKLESDDDSSGSI